MTPLQDTQPPSFPASQSTWKSLFGLPARGAARFVWLDVLRAVAIFLVLMHHTPGELPGHCAGRTFFFYFKQLGWAGVDLFFVLSGFLIGGLLFSEYARRGAIDLKRFLVRRSFKIWPALYFFLAVNALNEILKEPGSLGHRLGHTLHFYWPNLLHVQNYTGSFLYPAFGHTWSLAVEEHFYLALPLLLFLLARRAGGRPNPCRALPLVLGLVVIFCQAMRCLAAQEYSRFNFWHHIAPTHLRMDALALGVALAYAAQFYSAFIEKLRAWRQVLLLAGTACYLPALLAAQATPFIFTYGLTLQGIGAAGIVLWAWFASTGGKVACLSASAGNPPAPVLPVRALAFIGTFSYSIYLWHRPVAHSLAIKIKSLLHLHAHTYDFMVLMGIYLIVALVLGVVTYALIEGPALKLRNRLFPDASPGRNGGSPVPGVWDLAVTPSAQK